MRFARQPSDQEWSAQRVQTLPNVWQSRILGAWERARNKRSSDHWRAEGEAHRAANLELLQLTDRLNGHRLPLDASDAEIVGRAQQLAELCAERAQLYHQAEALYIAMCRVCEAQGVTAPKPSRDGELLPAVRRMSDPLWWRRQLRKLHAKNVEGAAIALGYVNRRREIYVSNQSLSRRQQQNRRNAQALEATIAENEHGQQYTLAELAARGTANKQIRRAELMTRISGFERIARDMGHEGLFLTMTCPSRMHKWRTVAGGRVIENPRYDGTTPREAQRHLSTVWARIRASLKRQETGIYGFRIAEPNHDGTPHWHLLVFHGSGLHRRLADTVRRYALQDSANEPGASVHRVDIKKIDWSRGTAAGYIAKYVAKNIDGYRVERDLYGNEAVESSARVEAWAATWGIRQFQQVGGPPVGPWRELRRVESVPTGAPEHLREAHHAVNKTAVFEGRESASVAWDRYCRAQGGVFCGRRYRIRIGTEDRAELGRYGEQLPPRPVGVETMGLELYHIGTIPAQRAVIWSVASRRFQWRIVGKGRALGEGEAFAPWTRVNNCTEGEQIGLGKNKNGSPNGDRGCGDGMGKSPYARQNDGRGLRGASDRHDQGNQRRVERDQQKNRNRRAPE